MTGSDCSLAVAIYGFLPSVRNVEPAGLPYECRLIRDKITLRQCTLPVFKSNNTEESSDKQDDDEDVPEDRAALFDADNEKYEKYLMKLDPNDTKSQDHYKVLGLSKLRWKATTAEIRTAYRQKVLKHHPDKKKHKGIPLPAGEDYFTCITKAYEQLGMSDVKRQAFDSVDHKFNETIPSEKSITKDNFFNELAPVFDLNARWSKVQPVPSLGKNNTSREDVEAFYNFWFDFQSWREFSYLDEEDKERGEDRYERREMDKINKAARARRSKEEAKRIRKLVEMAYAKDPRIVAFKKADTDAKNNAKEEKKRAAREKKEAAEKEQKDKEEAERKLKEAEELALKEKKAREKAEREAIRKAKQAQMKRFRGIADQSGHWSEDMDIKLFEMERVERLCLLLSCEEMSSLCECLEGMNLDDGEEVRKVIGDFETNRKLTIPIVKRVEAKEEKENEKSTAWTNEELQLLVKASNTFPAGTVDRWTVIGDYINEHRKDKSAPPKKEKEIIKQCKAVQSMNLKLPSSTQNQLGTALPDEDTWTPEEQKLLEECIRKYPSSDPDRWDKISTEVATKSKKACIRRFKYLVQMVKNKK